MEFQWFVKNDGTLGEVVDSLIAGDTCLAFYDIDTLPEIVAFTGKCVAAVIMYYKQGVHISNTDLFLNWVSKPSHDLPPGFTLGMPFRYREPAE